ncbi:MAG: aminomethyl transferase family protein [Desulfobacterales bacterium]
MENSNKTTPLYSWHVAKGATMSAFGGYLMPLWYASAKEEHLAVVTAAGLFDTSHMAVLSVDGTGALDLLQETFTQNLSACVGAAKSPLSAGRCVYGAFLNESGEVIDDSIVYQSGSDAYMAVVNAGMGEAIGRHLTEHKHDREATITDRTDRLGKVDLQGPMAAKILTKILADPTKVLDRMPYFSFKGHFDPAAAGPDRVILKNDTSILLSRTGYTGEFGFEIFADSKHLLSLWEMLLEAGSSYRLTVCGLAARDSLRAGAVLPLSHQDIGHWRFINHPWQFALPFTEDHSGFTKSFIGSQALLPDKGSEYTYAFVGQDLRKVSSADDPVVLDAHNKEIGKVLTCATDMAIGRVGDRIYSIASPDKPDGFKPKGLCCGFIKVNTELSVGETVRLKDKRRMLTVAIVNDVRPDRTARKPLRKML